MLAGQLDGDCPNNELGTLGSLVFIHVQLSDHDGVDPLPHIRRLTAMAREGGLDGVRLQLWEWDDAQFSQGPQARMVLGARLVEDIRRAQLAQRLPKALLQLAEAHAQAGSAGFRPLALEAAHDLRRGRGSPFDYAPDNLVRCARLLQDSDPSVAAALLQVAKRWALLALADAPAFARESFIHEVPVNRLLLSDEP